MTKEAVLQALSAGGFVSGGELSRQLGVSRAAVWKAVTTLRSEGYEIESVTNRGYRLAAAPAALTEPGVRALLAEHPWQKQVTVVDVIDSTNTRCKQLAAEGAPAGTVVIADRQTGGRGRLGRSFDSPAGLGVYFSVILRPTCPPTELTHLTAAVAVAVCDAVEEACGLRPSIKWTNDLVHEKHKLAGILTELSIEAETGNVQYAVVGIGLNCCQTPEDFPEEIRDMATSIAQATGSRVDRCALAAAMVRQMAALDAALLSGKEAYLARYEKDCVTIGARVRIVRGGEERFALATGIDGNAALKVRYDDGTEGIVNTGEVSVRGMYGYL